MRVYSGNAEELLGQTQTDELEVVWFLEAELLLTMLEEVMALRLETPILLGVALIKCWVLEAPMARAGWTSSTTEQGGIKWGIRGSGILDSEGSHR